MSKMNEEVNVNEEVIVEAEGIDLLCEEVTEKKSFVKRAIYNCGQIYSKHKKQIKIGAGIVAGTILAYAGYKHFSGSKEIVEIVDVNVLEDVVEDVAEVVEDQIVE